MRLLALDLELNSPSEKIIEVGACAFDTDWSWHEKRSWLVHPGEPIDPRITELTGITDVMVQSGTSLERAYTELIEWRDAIGAFINPLVWGHGDVQKLEREASELGLETRRFGRRVIDAKTVYVAWRIANGKAPAGGLAKAMTKFGLAFDGKKHRAADDAYNTARIFTAMLEQLKTTA